LLLSGEGLLIDFGLTRAIPRILPDALVTTIKEAPHGVSIVIPNWNHEYVLPRAIRSALDAVRLLSESQVEAEVLVIDDRSRDGSVPLLRQLEALYYDKRLRVLTLPRNNDVVFVRNLALLKAQYRYVVFMDADNELISGNIHTFYRAMRDTGAAMVYGNLLYRERMGSISMIINNESFQDRIIERNYIDTFALYDRVQIFDVGGYAEDFRMPAHEDWELVMHLAAAGRKMVFVPVVFGIYNELDKSRVGDTDSNDVKEMTHYLQRVFDQLGIRDGQPMKTRQLRYHPEVGYI
jgi:glycosyltransferase involved in cell wall biosynthesis